MTKEQAEQFVAWIRARLDDDKRTAERVLRFSLESYGHGEPEAWVAERIIDNTEPSHSDGWFVVTKRPTTVRRQIVRTNDLAEFDAEHIARFASPRRILRDIRARWEVLDDVLGVPAYRRDPILWALAAPYADHPGYLNEWQP